MERMLTAQEAADLLRVHRNTISRMLATGLLTGERVGRQVLIPLAVVESVKTAICPTCEKSFTVGRLDQRFCKPACRWAATNNARKASRSPPPAPDPTPAALRPAIRAIINGIRPG